MKEPTRREVDALPGTSIIEFGASWCGFCIAARPAIDQVLAENPHVRHIRVEDGSGKPLGRSFGVKLWPTLVIVHDGSEVARVVRPRRIDEIREALTRAVAVRPIASYTR